MFCCTATIYSNSMRDDVVWRVPPVTQNPAFFVTLTGVRERLCATGLLALRTRRVAAVALILLLLSMLRDNIYAAI